MLPRVGKILLPTLGVLLLVYVACAQDLRPALTEGVWVMRYDGKLDGKLEEKADTVKWKMAIRSHRVHGSLADHTGADSADHRFAGDLVEGKPALLQFRQDGPKGLVCYYTGRVQANGAVVGTWYDNRGGAGDFEFAPEKRATTP